MAYSEELIKEVRECYPDSPEMHRLAESGHRFLGSYLADSAQDAIALDTVLIASSLEELKEKAMRMKRKVVIYKKWCEEDNPEIKY